MMESIKRYYRNGWISVLVWFFSWMALGVLPLAVSEWLGLLLVPAMLVAAVMHIVSLAIVANLQKRSAVLWVLVMILLPVIASLIAFAVLNPESYRHKCQPDEPEPVA